MLSDISENLHNKTTFCTSFHFIKYRLILMLSDRCQAIQQLTVCLQRKSFILII